MITPMFGTVSLQTSRASVIIVMTFIPNCAELLIPLCFPLIEGAEAR
jgi:hypothetical protein